MPCSSVYTYTRARAITHKHRFFAVCVVRVRAWGSGSLQCRVWIVWMREEPDPMGVMTYISYEHLLWLVAGHTRCCKDAIIYTSVFFLLFNFYNVIYQFIVYRYLLVRYLLLQYASSALESEGCKWPDSFPEPYETFAYDDNIYVMHCYIYINFRNYNP